MHRNKNAPLFKYSQDTLHTNLVLNDKKFCKQLSRDLSAQVSNESLIGICFSQKKIDYKCRVTFSNLYVDTPQTCKYSPNM